MPSLEQVLERCRVAIADPSVLPAALDAAERLAWNDPDEYERLAEHEQQALDDLTEELDLFEPDPDQREAGMFGSDVALERVQRFVSRLGHEGAA